MSRRLWTSHERAQSFGTGADEIDSFDIADALRRAEQRRVAGAFRARERETRRSARRAFWLGWYDRALERARARWNEERPRRVSAG